MLVEINKAEPVLLGRTCGLAMQGETAKEVDAEQDRRKPSNPQSSDEGHLIEQGGDEENEHRSSSPSPSSPRTQTQAQTGARDPRISSLGIGTGSLDGLCEFCKKYGPVRQQYITAGAGKPALLVGVIGGYMNV